MVCLWWEIGLFDSSWEDWVIWSGWRGLLSVFREIGCGNGLYNCFCPWKW
jgi:hypothetical protein